MGACGAGCGITRERERDKDAALAAAVRAYPGWLWTAERQGPVLAPGADAIAELGSRLETLLPVRAIPRLGEGPGCDWLYLLAGVHAPSIAELFEGGAGPRAAPVEERETYLRIGFSPLGPFVTLQEVLMRAERMGGATAIVEEPLLGVVDRRLQAIVKGLQGALRKRRLVVLDMAFLLQEVDESSQPEFAALFESEPTRWSFLFEGTPPTTARAATLRLS
jgi:hypothetical protein